MNKPDWKDAPEWARWLAQDEDGWWSWWNTQPIVCEKAKCWNQGKPGEDWRYLDIHISEVSGDWKESLEARPA